MNSNSEGVPRRFWLTVVVLPGGSTSAARAAGSFNLSTWRVSVYVTVSASDYTLDPSNDDEVQESRHLCGSQDSESWMDRYVAQVSSSSFLVQCMYIDRFCLVGE